jgi:hypothetical protein
MDWWFQLQDNNTLAGGNEKIFLLPIQRVNNQIAHEIAKISKYSNFFYFFFKIVTYLLLAPFSILLSHYLNSGRHKNE